MRPRYVLCVLVAAVVAGVGGCSSPGVRLSESGSDPEPATTGLGTDAIGDVERRDGGYELITAENREGIGGRLGVRAVQSVGSLGISEERRDALGRAVEVSIAALLGLPEPMVAYQRGHGAELNGTVMRAWVDQLHVWKMLESVPDGPAGDLELFTRSVEVPEERFSAIDAVSVLGAEFGLGLNVQSDSIEWSHLVLVWKLSAWEPVSGYLSDSQGEEIVDGSSGRTVHITIPARFEAFGEGLLRVNFYWDEEGGYWVPHMVMMGLSQGAGKTMPMLLF